MGQRVTLCLIVILAVPAFLDAQWADLIGGSHDDLLIEAVPVKGGGVLAVGFSSNGSAGLEDGWLVKIDAKGKVVWQKSYGGAGSDVFRAIKAMNDGSYIIAGSTKSWASGDQDVWLLKVNASGAVLWQKTLGISSSSGFDYKFYVSRTAKTSNDGVLICGSVRKSLGSVTAQHIWCGLLKTSGEFVWTRLMGCDRGSEFPMATTVSSARPTRDGGAILAGTTTPYPELGTVDSDIWMAKLDETGAVVWAKSFDQDEGDDGADVAETPEGEFIIAGDVGPDWQHKNVLAMKTDADGAVVWQKQFGTATEDGACALVLPKEGGSFLACMSTFASGTWTGWGLRLNSDGRILWQSLYRWKAGTSAYWEASVQNASQTADGGYLVAGYTSPRGSWIENGFVLHLLSNGKACSAVSKPAGARAYPSSLRPVDVNLGAVGLTFAVKKPKATVRVQTIAWDDQCR